MYNEDYGMIFLKQKINEIKIALFKTEEIDLEPQLPNNIINTIEVGDDGTILFLTVFKGYHELNELVDKPFFASLEYYKKGSDCHLRLNGKATIVQNEEGTVIKNNPADNYGMVLISMKITHAECYEKKISTHLPWPQKIRSAISHLFVHYPRIYNFS